MSAASPAVRAFEFHSHRMWDRASIEEALDYMGRTGLNALVFHMTDIIDQLLFPDKFYGKALPLGQWPEFPILKQRLVQENNRQYMNRIIDLAHAKGVKIYFNIKEPWFPETLLYLYPELMDAKGQICPSNPFWWDYVETKVDQLFRQVPGLDGIIQSPGTIESKVNFSYSACTCERCQAMTQSQWIRNVTEALYKPLKAHGKEFIVRDFAYFPSELEAIFDVMKDMPADVSVSLKCAPHDFYPTFPQNPRIGKTEGHPQWVEFDIWGQYCGLGVFPCILLDDIRERVEYARANGAESYLARTDWEIVTDGWAMRCFSIINLYALEKYWDDPHYDRRRIYEEALRLAENIDMPFAGRIKVESDADLDGLIAILEQTWPIISRSLYIDRHLFQGNSMGAVVDSLEEARYTTVEHHSLSIWDPGHENVFANLNAANVARLLNEKQQAMDQVSGVVAALRAGEFGLNRRLNASMLSLFEAFELYVKQFYRSGRAYILTEHALASGDAAIRRAAEQEIATLAPLAKEIEAFAPSYRFEPQSNITAMLMNPLRMRSLAGSLTAALAAPAAQRA
jgi:hypothetical protein